MDPQPTNPPAAPRRSSVFRNWLSLTGFVVMVGSLFSFLLLFVMDAMAHLSNPYLGILFFLLLPGVFLFGLVLIPFGA